MAELEQSLHAVRSAVEAVWYGTGLLHLRLRDTLLHTNIAVASRMGKCRPEGVVWLAQSSADFERVRGLGSDSPDPQVRSVLAWTWNQVAKKPIQHKLAADMAMLEALRYIFRTKFYDAISSWKTPGRTG